MVFSLLAVVGKRHVAAAPRQLHRHRGREWNALVGRAEHHIELDAAGQQGYCIKLRQPTHLRAVVEQTRVEEIRAHAPRLGLEVAKAQHPRLHGKTHKILRQTVLLC